MLKVQKSKDSQIVVSLREKERLLTRLFLKAFALALVIHVSAFMLFRIQPFKIDSLFIFPPVQVQSQKSSYPQTALLQENEEAFPRFPIALFHPSPLLSKQEIKLELNPIAIQVPFERLERRILSLPQLGQSPIASYPSLKIVISGPLSQRQLLTEKPLSVETINHFKLRHYHLAYKVQLDEKSGLIFWYEKIFGSDRPEIDDAIEKILLSLRFEANPHLAVTTGQIDFFGVVDD